MVFSIRISPFNVVCTLLKTIYEFFNLKVQKFEVWKKKYFISLLFIQCIVIFFSNLTLHDKSEVFKISWQFYKLIKFENNFDLVNYVQNATGERKK